MSTLIYLPYSTTDETNDKGRTPLEVATSEDKSDIIEYLNSQSQSSTESGEKLFFI